MIAVIERLYIYIVLHIMLPLKSNVEVSKNIELKTKHRSLCSNSMARSIIKSMSFQIVLTAIFKTPILLNTTLLSML